MGKVPTWESLFVHRKQGSFLSVYVDDITVAGRKQNLAPMWTQIDGTCGSCGQDMLRKFCWDLDGQKYRTGQGLLLSGNVDVIEMVGRKQNVGSHVEDIDEKTLTLTNQLHFLITYIWNVRNVNANRMKLLLKNIQRCLNHVFLLEQLKNYQDGKSFTQKQ